jgi:uncharacterized heparinase superfamily protein
MASQWLKNLGHKASHVKMLRPLYDAQLGKLNANLTFTSFPPELIGGDGGFGRWVASNQIDLNGKRIGIDTENWFIGGQYQQTPYFTKIHQFDFLSDLKALGGDIGRKTARLLTQAWMDDFEKYHHATWSPTITAHRLVNWMTVYPYAFETATDEFIDDLHASIYKQFQHLHHSLDHDTDATPYERFDILWGLIVIANHCPQLATHHFDSWLHLLKGAVEDISNPDDGLITPNLDQWVIFASQLLTLKQSLSSTHIKIPLWLDKRIETITRALNLFNRGDKALPSFHGTLSMPKNDLDKLTRLSNIRLRRTDTVFKDSGYSAIRKGKTTAIINHGIGIHASPNAFELSHGPHPLIVNCGTHITDPQWADSLRGINAHSTVSIDGLEPDYDLIAPMNVTMESMNGACLWCGTCEGYKKSHHVTHTRRLYLDKDGYDFRGEDLLVRSFALKPITAMARFHLHPSVKASLIKNGTAILIQIPSGAGWIFEAAHCLIALEPSVYTGADGLTVRKTSQIILTAAMDDLSHQIKWAIRRQ